MVLSRHDEQTVSHWNVVAPFFSGSGGDRWLDDFVKAPDIKFQKIGVTEAPRAAWHVRRMRSTPVSAWLRLWRQGKKASANDPTGVITVFPQLAAVCGIQKALTGRRRKIIAWCFNVGAKPPRPLLWLARWAFKHVDQFVVHSSAEIAVVGDWFRIPPEKVTFVYLQRAPIEGLTRASPTEPFVIAMGSAQRDYVTLTEALRQSGLPAKIVASPRSLKGLSAPNGVEFLSGLSASECHELSKAALFSVVPLKDGDTAAGQVTVVEAMRLGRAVVATRAPGTVDYIRDSETGLLVEPNSPSELADAMTKLWNDAALRGRLVSNAAFFADEVLSDEAAAEALLDIMRKVERD